MNGVYVLTSPRKTADPWHYVRRVIQAAADERIQNPKYLVVDGDEHQADDLRAVAGDAWCVVRYERPAGQWLGGNKWPWWRLLQLARVHTPPGDEALTLEDDISFAPNALQRMLLLPIPFDVSAIHYFSGFLFKEPKMHPGLWRTPAAVQGCQAIKFTSEAIDLLCRWAESDDEWQAFNESDTALGVAQSRLRMRIAHHLPDVVQHIGAVSAVSHGMAIEAGLSDGATELDAANHTLGGRVSVNFAGEHFDCLRLFARHDLYT